MAQKIKRQRQNRDIIINKKRFGQHFLYNNVIIEKIVDAIHPNSSEHILEIGPGLGAITKPLLPLVKRLDSVELDLDLIPKLIDKFNAHNNFYLHQNDILKFDLNSICTAKEKIRIVGNLPYNISTPLLFYLLNFTNNITDMHFMVQKEVANRLAASPGNKAYGRLSIMIQYHCKVNFLFEVKPSAFKPPPKVDSAIIQLIPIKNKELTVLDLNTLKQVTTLAFNQRRKIIQNSLKIKLQKEDFEKLNIDPLLRPEQLSIKDYIEISNYLSR